jgi:catechol 2,3-dioxygenase-like lactoylglutathione lyase family enzyme
MTGSDLPGPRVLQMRVVVEAEDYETAVHFYRDVLGLPEQEAFEGDGGARVAILDAGRATLEIANPVQKRMIDEVEVGRPVAPKIRIAFEVVDSQGATDLLVGAGATLIASPVETPWRSLNSRLDAPAGLQITLFQELETFEERTAREGFRTDAARGSDTSPVGG